ncbi:quaternary amine ABC transporter ATP-binding protein [Anaerovorax sp. IOR16]|uniref:quaternary amine ABC transporter ATP-binding protein n=1 Tax=Anaerovorax sp. IOR16 TaxID=2773458 RepID=UPI0019D04120|nr:betaine/proline/choline family ABC transporter ATP-binding protein [Anaerovorax sp. IOR16]
MKKNNFILKMEHVTKLYGPNRAEASKMMTNGSNKDEVNKKTGCTVALWDVNLEIPKEKIFVIIGLSGSGKSTAVRCFNRLTDPTGGKVVYEDRNVHEMSKKELLEYRRNKISMVFQSFGLMSHRDVLGNVSYGLEVKGIEQSKREEIAKRFISMIGLDGWEHQSCGKLSGGMRQRVGIARALVNDPEVLLMDEPFSALDPLVRRDMQFELLQIQRKLKKTIVFITHDIDEAFKMGDTVCIMKDGKVVQTGTPEELSMNPTDDYVRDFLETADKTKVMTVRNIMITPSCIVRLGDNMDRAVHEMRKNNLSSVIVMDDELHPKGMLFIGEALQARKDGKSIAQVLQTGIATISADTLVSDVILIATESAYPIAVTDEDGVMLGIVTKASILSSLN